MGLIKDLVGSAMGSGQVNNGFNQPLVPSFSRGQSRNSSSSRPLSPRPDYRSYSNGKSDRGYLAPEPCYDDFDPPRSRGSSYQQQSYDDRRHDAEYDNVNSSPSNWTDPPPPYGTQLNVPNSYDQFPYPSRYSDSSRQMYDQRPSQAYYQDRERPNYNSSPLQQSRSRQNQGFRPFAVPQVAGGDGQPFLRAYSDELRQYGIEEGQFIQVVDAINKAIIPNPENMIFQKAANIAGWFVPGAGGIALMAGQIGVGAGAAFGHASLVAKTLSRSNLDLFIPAGLEICIGKSDNVDQEARVYGRSSSQQYSSDPESRIAAYGNRLAPLSSVHPPLANTGRSDPIAMLANGMSKRSAAKKAEDAAKDRAEGKLKKKDDPDAKLQWLIVRRASPQSTQKWQQMLQQSEASLDEERRQAAAQGSSQRY
ncbi:hypothetical protein M409DRAFT_24953 [Zasmidium cellare ATCC 36951]|uniref:Uncharacterized protein n=1 Tax=Zasmidium cellare ATCC 36951 TaxID=1080233 RepID=A0A6A6CCT2_ZASCE|nr:uncharacterized protein M409DRAFT_24953 [Zasmidium cellare ATCC 36951]KAF2164553.1 hypothetical protein M409DRAFT_24953 [Zasmidium cellare ATCC 36951]